MDMAMVMEALTFLDMAGDMDTGMDMASRDMDMANVVIVSVSRHMDIWVVTLDMDSVSKDMDIP